MSDEPLKPYPWQAAIWHELVRRHRADRLPHALLLTGPQGIGKRSLAAALAQALLCEQPEEEGTACGRCRGCTLYAAGSHPDFLMLEPLEEGKSITVDRVRGVVAFQGLKGQYGNRRVAIVSPADRLNVNAANALLKTLEEPTADMLLLLCSSRPSALLPTIRSRCQQVPLPPATPEQAGEWLQNRVEEPGAAADLLAMSGGAPLAALELASGEQLMVRESVIEALQALSEQRELPLAVAEQWFKGGAEPVLRWLSSCLTDLIRLRSAPHSARLSNPDLRGRLQPLAEQVDLGALYRLLDRTQQGVRQVQHQVNAQLVLEEIVITWARYFRALCR
ncbi:DNA polymerase III subunit delta' [Thiohalomonas denitrificans]|uniref:DNA polymerase III subunit delta' n=1 Tax=Thiohalomonas denitrificans TaxID=415747 RepID=A0A1G5QC09_9GAMM|nr:DNA polymerase III subunit delta' [Thiohalomonas denitrificans]SCZ59126.1 DNA polymerase-3 subunit delta' [Thiohalomonas denitrificans]